MRILRLTLSFFYFTALSFSQDAPPEIKTIDEVIQGIDDLLSGVDAANEPQKYTDPSKTLLLPGTETLDRPFRLENELMPGNILVQDDEPLVSPDPIQQGQPEEINLNRAPSLLTPSPQPSFSQGANPDYSSASLDDLLREVESLELPEFVQPMVLPTAELATPLPSPVQPPAESTVAKDVILSPILQKDPQAQTPPLNVDDYTVLGQSIDYE